MRIALISIDDLASAPPPPTLRFPVAKLVNLDSQGDGGDGFGPQRHAGAGRVSRAGEVLRRLENARGLQYYAGWARESKPREFALAASAARSAAGQALDFAARAMINVHGGIGATREHDAPLFFRRAQLSRRLLAGTHDAT